MIFGELEGPPAWLAPRPSSEPSWSGLSGPALPPLKPFSDVDLELPAWMRPRPKLKPIEQRNRQIIDPDEWEPGEEIPLPDHIASAIKCGDLSKVTIRNWRALPVEEMTRAEKGMFLLEDKCRVPAGKLVGKPLKFLFFQEVCFYLMIDLSPRNVLISMARRNSKTLIQACIVLLLLISFLSETNMVLGSFALAREQAALLFKQITDMIRLSPDLEPLMRVTPSGKKIEGLRTGAIYTAGSAEAKSNLGQSLKYIVLDEAGSIVGPDNEYTQMLRTSQGSYDDATFAAISTQAASDADYFSVLIDDAIRMQPTDTVCIVFETPKHYDIDDEEGWLYSNPGLGVFRSIEDMRTQAKSARRIPAQEGGFRNLSLNQRTAMAGVWLAPSVYKDCGGPVDFSLFTTEETCLALDLSARQDLTAAVLAAKDPKDKTVHIHPYVFCPTQGIEERQARDRAPYKTWIDQGYMIPLGGKSMDYDQIAGYLKREFEEKGVVVKTVVFDRWGIDSFKKACARINFLTDAVWVGVGQGFKDMGPRTSCAMTMFLDGRIRHGMHPCLNSAFSHAISVRDPAGSVKLDKSKATQRIDAAVAAVMAIYSVTEGEETNEDKFDVSAFA